MIHHFTPTRYHVTIGWHEPVLHVKDGDTIVTTTVDARGRDHTDTAITPRGNPQTGPFYVEDAEPGDTLAVHFDRLAPNRAIGWTGRYLAPNVLDPGYVRNTAESLSDAKTVCRWEMDLDRWTATLIDPADTRIGRFTLSLSPMLGCFGVAPSLGQAISCATSGPYGGNMDYKDFKTGTTVYFPVFAPGALLHVGDGHAVQGDGEIVGTGIEISFDVQITVRVIKGKTIEWLRGETDTHIFAVGNARPLDQALQHATTEMARWLQTDYGLDQVAAHTLLGQCVEYEIGNVYDPAYTMVCKVKKSILRQIGVIA
ncbi:MAG: acetamidase/formamidase family protein [candidate division Zixibacteria bacterium]|nr:acetamidase/formamidase family protein [candidate division Zixibacteria bacterium]